MLKKLLLGLLLLSPLSLYPFLRAKEPEYVAPPPVPLTEAEKLALRPNEELAAADPIAFLERCLARYEKEVNGYTCVFNKREKVNGAPIRDPEQIKVHFRQKPFSVHMDWISGNEVFGARKSLYVEGETDGFLWARPSLPGLAPQRVLLNDNRATSTSRFPITEFGMYKGAESTLSAMRKAKERNKLFVKYEGIGPVEKAGNVQCYKLVRTPYDPPEQDRCNELIIYIERKSLLQVGSVLKDPEGKVIAEYFVHTIVENPTFSETQFDPKGAVAN